MPAPGQRDHTALPARIRLWLLDNPGSHRPAEVAAGLGVPDGMTRAQWSQKVANAMSRLVKNGDLVAVDLRERMGWKGRCTGYHLPAPKSSPTPAKV